MLLLLGFLTYLYGNLIYLYSNINLLSNIIALIYGFLYCFADPEENQNLTFRNIFIILHLIFLKIFINKKIISNIF